MNGSHHSSNDANSTLTASAVDLTSTSPTSARSPASWPSAAPRMSASSAASGSRTWTPSQNGVSGLLPSACCQTVAATIPPGRVTRAISRTPAWGSAMNGTTRLARVASNVASA